MQVDQKNYYLILCPQFVIGCGILATRKHRKSLDHPIHMYILTMRLGFGVNPNALRIIV